MREGGARIAVDNHAKARKDGVHEGVEGAILVRLRRRWSKALSSVAEIFQRIRRSVELREV